MHAMNYESKQRRLIKRIIEIEIHHTCVYVYAGMCPEKTSQACLSDFLTFTNS